MSAWQLVTRRLHLLGGGPLSCAALDDVRDFQTKGALYGALHQAKQLGLLQHDGGDWRTADQTRSWSLTALGRDWCEGRLRLVAAHHPPGAPGRPPLQWGATWLSALPRDLRIKPATCACGARRPITRANAEFPHPEATPC